MDAERAEEYAKSVSAKHFHTSAKRNQGIEEMFDSLIDDMIQGKKTRKQSSDHHHGQGQQQRKTITLVDDDDDQANNGRGKKKAKCSCGGGSNEVEMPVDNNDTAADGVS